VVVEVLALPESHQPLVLGQIVLFLERPLDMLVAEVVRAPMVKEQEMAEAPLQTKVLAGLVGLQAQYKLLAEQAVLGSLLLNATNKKSAWKLKSIGCMGSTPQCTC
jgi:hypothetical protein